MRAFLFACGLSIALVSTASAQGASKGASNGYFVGTWELSSRRHSTTIEFKKDGTMRELSGPVRERRSGTWSFNAATKTLTQKWNGSPVLTDKVRIISANEADLEDEGLHFTISRIRK